MCIIHRARAGSMAHCGGASSSHLTPSNCAPSRGALAVAKRARSSDSSTASDSRWLARQRDDASPLQDEDSFDEQEPGDENAGVASEQPAAAAAAAAVESAADRETRELAESEALARQFMEEEAMASYEVCLCVTLYIGATVCGAHCCDLLVNSTSFAQ
jgi:hypothetical protein